MTDSPVRPIWGAWGQRLFNEAMEDNLRRIRRVLLRAASNQSIRLLDVGCWDGETTVRYAPAGASSFGVELSEWAAKSAGGRSIRAVVGNLDDPLPWRSESFDAVTSNQVIEHLSDTDRFLSEAYRVLRPGGLLVASTENMASWHNILALLLGWQAFSLTNVTQRAAGIGNPLANLRGQDPFERGWAHLRVFSYRGLLELVRAHGFVDVRILGSGYYPFPATVAHRDPRHAAFITAVARRPTGAVVLPSE